MGKQYFSNEERYFSHQAMLYYESIHCELFLLELKVR